MDDDVTKETVDSWLRDARAEQLREVSRIMGQLLREGHASLVVTCDPDGRIVDASLVPAGRPKGKAHG